MKLRQLAFHGYQLGLLRAASLLVPSAQRAEWRQEWSSELWHVRRECAPIDTGSAWNREWEITAFCMGAFKDAAFLFRHARRRNANSMAMHESPAQCAMGLCAALVLCAVIAGYLPGIRSEQDAAQSPLRPGVILIQRDAPGMGGGPSISLAEYGEWYSHRQQFFADLVFYRADRSPVVVANMRQTIWTVAHATQSLFKVLGTPKSNTGSVTRGALPQAMLSETVWRRDFRSDPAVVGTIVTVAGRRVQIAGIAPAAWDRMPSHPDLWLMEPDARLVHGVHGANGYLIAQLSAAGRAQMIGDSVEITTESANGAEVDLRGFAFTAPTNGPLSIYLFALFLAILALPASTSVAKSESNFTAHPPSFRSRAIRWSFLAAKLVLVAFIGYFASLDLAYCGFPNYSPTAEFLQFVTGFCLCLFGLRWAVMDQSQRCPVCLRRVTHPAQVGIASCTFLGWNGTEMICTGGHTILHVPSLPTSWFSGQRWTYLDTSWDFLFADLHSQG